MNGDAHGGILVVGIGNPDRGDDGIGPLIVERLAEQPPSDVRLIVRSGDMLGLVDDWAEYDAVICIDAAAPLDTPGRIRCVDATSGHLAPGPLPASSHAFSLGEAIALARALGTLPGEVMILAIEGACFGAGAVMTPSVSAAVGEAVRLVHEEITRLHSREARAHA